MRLLLTGAKGFLGWHLKCLNLALYKHEIIDWNRFSQPESIPQPPVDMVLHLASRMRGADYEIYNDNFEVTSNLIQTMKRMGSPSILVHANSIQSGNESAFGLAKAQMSSRLRQECEALGWQYYEIFLPNIFGERALPNHNSFIATAIESLIRGSKFDVFDRELDLVYAQDAARLILEPKLGPDFLESVSVKSSVGEMYYKLRNLNDAYVQNEIPAIESNLSLALFNSLRFAIGPKQISLSDKGDNRGRLLELANFQGNSSTVFASDTEKLYSRGNHFHLHKFERFIVLSGRGQIVTRELFTEQREVIHVDGASPIAVDIPTFTAHKLVNDGANKLFGVFISSPAFENARPDTYSIDV
jgi:UDP-2-acetamido-2,6-beta-L-arabino-hexul-4-ose reductase